MLATNRCAGIVLFAVAADLFEHLRVDFMVAPLGQQVERLTTVQVIVELAVGTETGERPASYQATLPQPAQASVSDIFIASCEPHNLGSRTESVPQDSIEDIEVAVGDRSRPPGLGPDEFGEFLRGHGKSLSCSDTQPECAGWSRSLVAPSASTSERAPPVRTGRLLPRRPPRSAFPSVREVSAWRSKSESAADV